MRNLQKAVIPAAVLMMVACMTYNVALEEPYRLKAGGEFIDIPSPTYAGPLMADYDLDGLDDLIVGTFRGHFRLYKNTGTAAEPAYDEFSLIQAAGRDAQAQNW